MCRSYFQKMVLQNKEHYSLKTKKPEDNEVRNKTRGMSRRGYFFLLVLAKYPL